MTALIWSLIFLITLLWLFIGAALTTYYNALESRADESVEHSPIWFFVKTVGWPWHLVVILGSMFGGEFFNINHESDQEPQLLTEKKNDK